MLAAVDPNKLLATATATLTITAVIFRLGQAKHRYIESEATVLGLEAVGPITDHFTTVAAAYSIGKLPTTTEPKPG